MRARLDDAKFFYEEDPEDLPRRVPRAFAKVAFQEKLGSVLAKSERIEQLALAIAREAHLGAILPPMPLAPRTCARPTWYPTPSSSSRASRA